MVLILEIPRTEQTCYQTEEVNCAPWSEVRRAGMPNPETQVEIKAIAQVSNVMEDSGIASDFLKVLLIIVSRELYPWLAGNGPTRSRCTREKRLPGTSLLGTVELMWDWILLY